MNGVIFTKPNDYLISAYCDLHSYMSAGIPMSENNEFLLVPEQNMDIDENDVGRYSVFEVANWFLSKESMTHKKIQKLCYYAQAWCFALRGYRLEATDYEAWIHGPVSPVLWERFKIFGYDCIRIDKYVDTKIQIEDIHLLEDIWDTYGDNTGNALEALSHRELPWIEARKGFEPYERCSVVISPKIMASYYKSIYNGD